MAIRAVPERSRRSGSIGWALLLLGLLILVERFWGIGWGWGLFGLGMLFLAAAPGKRVDTILMFPGTVFLVTGAAVLARQIGLADFPLWLLWPIFFGSVGLAFLMLWIVRYSGWWAFIPGGFLLFVAGAGVATHSWYL